MNLSIITKLFADIPALIGLFSDIQKFAKNWLSAELAQILTELRPLVSQWVPSITDEEFNAAAAVLIALENAIVQKSVKAGVTAGAALVHEIPAFVKTPVTQATWDALINAVSAMLDELGVK